MTVLRRWTAALAVVALTLSGCGLPDRTDPKYVGPAANPSPAQDRALEPPKPDDANNLSDLVVRYLKTSVGGNVTSADQPDAVSETQARMKTFMTDAAKESWRPQQPLVVVSVKTADLQRDENTGKASLWAQFTPVGQLDRLGRLSPWTPPLNWQKDFQFKAEEVGGKVLLSAVPNFMLLSTAGLDEWYLPQPVYFWERDVNQPKLVPDLRFMPRVLPASKRVSEVMLWLAEGPSPWLSTVAEKLPSDIETKDDPTLNSDKSVGVNLSSKARGKSQEDLRKLASQIRWSLDGHPPVSLSFENAKDPTNYSDGYENDNAAVTSGELDQEKFVVFNETARPADIPAGGPPELFAQSEWNKAVVSATINRAHTRAALVRQVGGKQQLFVNAESSTEKAPRYVDGGVTGLKLSRPVWINRPVQRFLVADGARLWAVTPPAGGEPAKAEVVPGLNDTDVTNVSAFSVSPDGRRIALIVNNKTRIAALRLDNGKLSFGGELHQVNNALGDNQAVGWISETTLAIGGRPNPTLTPEASYSLMQITVDGTGETPLPLLKPAATSTFVVTQLSARTNDPTDSPQVLVLFEANQAGRVVFGGATDVVQLRNYGPSPDSSASASPKQPLSPFYAD